jgi:hypothetical protein
MHVCVQETPHEACLAALTRLKTLSLAQPSGWKTGRPMGTGDYGDKLTLLSSLCSLQVEAAVACPLTATLLPVVACGFDISQ